MKKGTFAPGSKVLMADGTEKEIETIVVGDSVYTYNISTNELEAGTVTAIKAMTHGNMIIYQLNNSKSLTCSFEQPIYTLDFVIKSWSPEETALSHENAFECEQFRCLDLLFDADTKLFDVETSVIDIDWSKEDKMSHLIEVDKNDNYFVEKILVRA